MRMDLGFRVYGLAGAGRGMKSVNSESDVAGGGRGVRGAKRVRRVRRVRGVGRVWAYIGAL